MDEENSYSTSVATNLLSVTNNSTISQNDLSSTNVTNDEIVS